mmetsp:Transcript_23887/g.52177  ORF Transcript_23887/g.52177 Transcript_23887/m.52177 type:complete len:208 (-) Transcript_23887:242-865(-)
MRTDPSACWAMAMPWMGSECMVVLVRSSCHCMLSPATSVSYLFTDLRSSALGVRGKVAAGTAYNFLASSTASLALTSAASFARHSISNCACNDLVSSSSWLTRWRSFALSISSSRQRSPITASTFWTFNVSFFAKASSSNGSSTFWVWPAASSGDSSNMCISWCFVCGRLHRGQDFSVLNQSEMQSLQNTCPHCVTCACELSCFAGS